MFWVITSCTLGKYAKFQKNLLPPSSGKISFRFSRFLRNIHNPE
jgi:hypothetical protein